MDCFYAAIEIRDNPSLQGKPVAVGGKAKNRGVICTANYIARKFGIHSAMATAHATKLCPNLILLPINMTKYKKISTEIQKIFYNFTELVEPLSLDEAFLDVTQCSQFKGSATLIATAIRGQITLKHKLSASAGVAPNKFLAKIASDWNKPNGMLVITPKEVDTFMPKLPITKIFGVGKVTANKLKNLNLTTCADLQKLSLNELISLCGSFGSKLYELCRGIDYREVIPNRICKSLSVEETYAQDLNDPIIAIEKLKNLIIKLKFRLVTNSNKNLPQKIKKLFIKIKFYDFTHTSVECIANQIDLARYETLFHKGYMRQQKPIRLLGIGVRFDNKPTNKQLEFAEFNMY